MGDLAFPQQRRFRAVHALRAFTTLLAFLSSERISGLGSDAVAGSAIDYKLETAYIYQFTNFIEWPERSPSQLPGIGSFSICVVGSSPVIQELESLAKSKTIKGREIKIYKSCESAAIRRSNVVVMASAEMELLRRVTQEAKGSNALIVSYAEGFAESGSAINFFIEDGRLRFEINRAALEAQDLHVSSQLLKLARLVE